MRNLLNLLVGFVASGCVAALLLLNAGVWKNHTVMAESANVAPEATQRPQKRIIEFPMAIPGTELTAIRLASYEGPDIESGSDRNLVNAAALEIVNTGTKGIERAVISLCAGEDKWTFSLTCLPPGTRILVIEEKGRPCETSVFDDISALSINNTAEELLPNFLIEDISMGCIRITNTIDQNLKTLMLFYKNTTEDDSMLIGGNTYHYALGQLRAGESIELNLPQYAKDCSKIISVLGKRNPG